jgi:hypothetical protein
VSRLAVALVCCLSAFTGCVAEESTTNSTDQPKAQTPSEVAGSDLPQTRRLNSTPLTPPPRWPIPGSLSSREPRWIYRETAEDGEVVQPVKIPDPGGTAIAFPIRPRLNV